MESWQSDLEKRIVKVLWSQWSAVGLYVTAEPCRGSVIDPEALLVATCAFGRIDARMFDEALDWTIVNHGLLKPWRLKRISRSFGPAVQRTLGAVLEYAAEDTGKNLFPGVRREMREALDMVEAEELFWREKGRYDQGRRPRDELFARWKLWRGTPRVRRHSAGPEPGNPANLMFRLRDYYGAGARADVMTYLLTEKGGSSHGIAKKIKYQYGQVYKVLENLVEAGIAHKKGGLGNAYYWIDQKGVAASLGLGRKRPVFFVWGDIFSAFHAVVSDWRAHQAEYMNDFLSSERMRDLAAVVIPLLRGAGEPLSRMPAPDARKLKGTEHREALMDFLDRAEEVVERYTVS
jgi:hypothetical protein